jgi:hypothetical protein
LIELTRTLPGTDQVRVLPDDLYRQGDWPVTVTFLLYLKQPIAKWLRSW